MPDYFNNNYNRNYSRTPFINNTNNINNNNNNYYYFSKKISNSTSNFQNSLNTLRNILISRGPKSIFIFQRLFTLTHSNKIDFSTFDNITQTYKLNISNNEKKTIFNYFDNNNSNSIFYDKLIKLICGNLNDFRLNIVINVFNSFKLNNNNKINVNNILNYYNKNNHPDVINNKKTGEEIFCDFIDMINIFKEYNEFLYNKKFDFWSLNEFVEFYTQISMGITDDEYFEVLMKSVWGLEDNSDLGFNNNNNNNNNNNSYLYDSNNINNERIKTGNLIINGGY
jgi:Ca2+-binding EF-hand superfamily protein